MHEMAHAVMALGFDDSQTATINQLYEHAKERQLYDAGARLGARAWHLPWQAAALPALGHVQPHALSAAGCLLTCLAAATKRGAAAHARLLHAAGCR